MPASTRSSLAVNQFSDYQKEVAVEAARRYGAPAAFRLLKEMWPDEYPSLDSHNVWKRQRADQELSRKAVDYWDHWETQHRNRLQANLASRFPSLLEALDDAISSRAAKDIRDLAVAVGIIFDKIAPPSAGGGGMTLIGGSPRFQITTYGPAQPQTLEVIEGTVRELPPVEPSTELSTELSGRP